MKAILTICLLISFYANAIAAGVNGSINVRFPSANWNGSDPESLRNSLSSGAATGLIDGNLAQGHLRAVASIASGGGIQDFATAGVTFSDTVTFSGTSVSQTVRFHYLLSAVISPLVGNVGASAELDLSIAGSLYVLYFTNRSCPALQPPIQLECYFMPEGSETGFARGGVITIPNAAGTSLAISSSLTASAGGPGQFSNAGNSAYFYLEVPDGMTYTSQSGIFLTQAAPIPENSIWLMLATGLLAICSMRHALKNTWHQSVTR